MIDKLIEMMKKPNPNERISTIEAINMLEANLFSSINCDENKIIEMIIDTNKFEYGDVLKNELYTSTDKIKTTRKN